MIALPFLKDEFLLNKELTFLNYGSFGACPKTVFEAYQKYQLQLEYNPVDFIKYKSAPMLLQAREALGNFLGTPKENLVFVTNPSYAVNIVAKNLQLNSGDEVLTTNLEYGACDKTWDYICKQKNAKYIKQKISLPFTSEAKIVEELFEGVTAKTKLIFLSHITSSTALILPIEEICIKAKSMDIAIFIDGAHVPGHIPLNLAVLNPDYYTGACHKWMLTPKGSSFLYASDALKNNIDPLIVSWGYDSTNHSGINFIDYHEQQGTRDISAFLATVDAINFMEKHNWQQVTESCKALTLKNANTFAQVCGSHNLSPINNDFIGQMVAVPLKTKQPLQFEQYLAQQYKIVIPVSMHENNSYIRYSINAFNCQKDLDYLFEVIEKEMKQKTYIG